jgi:hypothetical protein
MNKTKHPTKGTRWKDSIAWWLDELFSGVKGRGLSIHVFITTPISPQKVEVQWVAPSWPKPSKKVTHDGKGWMLDVKLVIVAIFFFGLMFTTLLHIHFTKPSTTKVKKKRK